MRILIVAGGSGGHVFPAVRLGEEILSRGAGDVLFVTSCRKNDSEILRTAGFNFKIVPVEPLQSKGIIPAISFILKLIAGSVKSMFILLCYKPSVVIGFGGYVSGPIVLGASLFRIKTIIHEQNVYPGKANTWLAGFVDKIAISFEGTKKYFKKYGSKILITGNFLRSNLKRTEKDGDEFTILAMGGSQGAGFLNRVIPEALGRIEGAAKYKLNIIHISGEKDKKEVEKNYLERGIKNKVISFTNDIDKLYSESDFVISRAGATTISELLFLAKPCILIPYPHAGFHQRLNAGVLEETGSAVLMEEGKFNPDDLKETLVRFMDREFLKNMSDKTKDYKFKNGCGMLIKEIKR